MLSTIARPGAGGPGVRAFPLPHARHAPRCPARRPAAAAPTPPAARIDPLALAQHRPQLVKFAQRRLRDPAAAEDVVQETLLAALEGAARFQGDAAVGTWLTGILKHKILDHFRRARRSVSSASDADGTAGEDLEAAAAQGEPDASGWGDPEAAFAQERFFEVLERGIARLSGKAARAFRLREVLGMSIDEVSAELGITASHCSVLLHRARKALREHLQAEWFGGAGASGQAGETASSASGPAGGLLTWIRAGTGTAAPESR